MVALFDHKYVYVPVPPDTVKSIWPVLFPKHKIFDSGKLWSIILNNSYRNEFVNHKLKVFESAFFEWDNTPRYKNKAKIFTGISFEKKKQNFKKLIKLAQKNDSPYVFFNAWNEWSESAYLEPDKKNGYRHLEIIKETLYELKKDSNYV